MDEQDREASKRLSPEEFKRWKAFRHQGEKQEEAVFMAALGEMSQALLEAQKTTMRLTEENRALADMARHMTGQVPGLERILGDIEELEAESMRLMSAAPAKYLEQLVRMGVNGGRGVAMGVAAEDSPRQACVGGATGSTESLAPASDGTTEEGSASGSASLSLDSLALLAPDGDDVPDVGAGISAFAAADDAGASPGVGPQDALALEAPDSDAVPTPWAGFGKRPQDPGGGGRRASSPEDTPADTPAAGARQPARRTRRARGRRCERMQWPAWQQRAGGAFEGEAAILQ